MSFRLRMPARLVTLPLALAALLLGGASVAAATPMVTVSCDASGLPQVATVNCEPFYVVASGFSAPVTNPNSVSFTINHIGNIFIPPAGATSPTTSGSATIFVYQACTQGGIIDGPGTVTVSVGAQTASADFQFIHPTSCGTGVVVNPPGPFPNPGVIVNPLGPDPSATPELDSLVLFGSGASGIGGYALLRLRSRRQRR